MTTSSNRPSKFVFNLVAKIIDWRIVVVGTEEAATDGEYVWESLFPTVIYLGPSDQKELGYSIAKMVPVGSKNFGFLFAIQHGAKSILETIDSGEDWEILDEPQALFLPENVQELDFYEPQNSQGELSIANPFEYFLHEAKRSDNSSVKIPIWPRGYPLTASSPTKFATQKSKHCRKVYIQHR